MVNVVRELTGYVIQGFAESLQQEGSQLWLVGASRLLKWWLATATIFQISSATSVAKILQNPVGPSIYRGAKNVFG